MFNKETSFIMNITELFETLKSCDIADIYIVGAGKYGKVLGAYFDKNGVMWGGLYRQK